MDRPDMRDSAFELATPKEFNFRACLNYMARSANECLFEVSGDRVIRPLRLEGGRIILLGIGSPDDRQLRVEVLAGAPLARAETEEASAFIRDWFDLDRELGPFYRMAAGHPVLGGVVESFYGLRLIGIPDLFEALCWAIVGQQVNLTFAYTLKRRLAETYGASLEWDGRTFRLFPPPEMLAAADPGELGALQLTRAKAAAIRDIAALMSQGALSRALLLSLGSYDAAERELVRVRGIGPWTAHYVRMRCLRDPRAFPIGDVGLHNAVKAQLGLDRKPTLEELRELFADFAGWEAYATFYLWRTLY